MSTATPFFKNKMLRKLSILSLAAVAVLFIGCDTEDDNLPWGPGLGTGGGGNTGEDTNDEWVAKPIQPANNIVVAHRGVCKEISAPDNSLASLRGAIALGLYGSECDIYWTKDDNVIIAHADSNCKINNLYPWENTVAELRRGGVLSNGEILPTLEEYIKVAALEGKCTKLILDIKNITAPSTISAATRAQYCIKACKRAIEIAQSFGAEEYIEFICTGNETVMTGCAPLCETAAIPIGWMANKAATEYDRLGAGCKYAYRWANLSLEYMNDGIIYSEADIKAGADLGKRTIDEFVSRGIEFSCYNADTDQQMDYYSGQSHKLKSICTNYPKKLLRKMGK